MDMTCQKKYGALIAKPVKAYKMYRKIVKYFASSTLIESNNGCRLNVYMNNIHNPLAHSITIPYMGSGEEEGKAEGEIGSKEELLALVADMNRDFS